MILVDFNQVLISNLMMKLGNHTNAELSVDLLRHMALNSIRSYKMKFGDEFGEMVICCDDKNYWRKDVFPYYKANRKKNREESELDWTLIFEAFNQIRSEIKEFFPYRVILIPKMEADDIIYVLTKFANSMYQPVLIMSGDKDFIQLHNVNTKQYDPVKKKFITHDDPKAFLKEHIIRGDAGDGIPNFLSDDNCMIIGKRQSKIYAVKVAEWINMQPEEFCTTSELTRNYARNESLIDLKGLPSLYADQAQQEYASQAGKGRDKLFNYFIKNRLKNLIDAIGDF